MLNLGDIANKIKKLTNCKVVYKNKSVLEKFPNLSLKKTKKLINLKISSSILRDIPYLVKNFK